MWSFINNFDILQANSWATNQRIYGKSEGFWTPLVSTMSEPFINVKSSHIDILLYLLNTLPKCLSMELKHAYCWTRMSLASQTALMGAQLCTCPSWLSHLHNYTVLGREIMVSWVVFHSFSSVDNIHYLKWVKRFISALMVLWYFHGWNSSGCAVCMHANITHANIM